MSFSQAVRTCFAKYASFRGRASRSEYWYFVLFLFLGTLALGLIDRLVFGTTLVETVPGYARVEANGFMGSAFSLATLIPLISSGWRRMHDSGRSGLYLFYPVIVMIGIVSFMAFMVGLEPVMAGDYAKIVTGASGVVMMIAAFVLLISPLLVLWWLARPSDPGPNAYGPPPAQEAPTT